MIKIICLAAIIAVVAAMPNGPSPANSPPQEPTIVKRAVDASEGLKVAEKDSAAKETTEEAQDDMDKAETFGFGYHKVIHVHAPYYPAYHHYYPRYYPSHYYGHYW
ncbi:AGAP006985-PA-like protein [Anopheles sinensis]|uniref:AGAP006985-PA-like protein n=1 Tax=Anopheles sinensis TaxID=74873 RepID=A0A084WRN9_ANOSI|nr:AGAP006985-PA-like protein [Anopheles sinensis]